MKIVQTQKLSVTFTQVIPKTVQTLTKIIRGGPSRWNAQSVVLVDSCHGRVMQNQQNLYSYVPPTAVVKLLQYSGLGSNTGMGFLHEMRSAVELKMVFLFGIWVLLKKKTLAWMVVTAYKLKENLEKKTP